MNQYILKEALIKSQEKPPDFMTHKIRRGIRYMHCGRPAGRRGCRGQGRYFICFLRARLIMPSGMVFSSRSIFPAP